MAALAAIVGTGAGWGAGAEPAGAREFDRTPLFAQGAWTVAHTYDASDGSSWCVADTENAASQWFSFVAYDDGGAALFIGDPAWRLAPREIDFRIDVDAEQWEVTGAGSDAALSVVLDDPEATASFLAQLMEGRALAVFGAAERRVARFSLDGSRGALAALFECWTRIDLDADGGGAASGGAADPFIRASDPFGAATP